MWGFRPSRVHVHAVADVPVDADGSPFPLLVFSPSGNPPHFYSALLEELASHGYVVAGISHTYETIPISVFPNGGVRVMRPKALAGAFSIPSKRPFQDDLRDRGRLVETKAGDIRFVIDRLTEAETETRTPSGHVDGIGSASSATRSAAARPRRHAGWTIASAPAPAIDGGLWRLPEDVGASGPFLQLFGEHPEYTTSCDEAVAAKYYATGEYCVLDRQTTVGAWQALHERARPGHSVLVRGAGHASFIDWPLLPLWRFALARRGLGSLAEGVAWRLTSDYLLGFFNRHLRDARASLLDEAGDDARVTIAAPQALFSRRD